MSRRDLLVLRTLQGVIRPFLKAPGRPALIDAQTTVRQAATQPYQWWLGSAPSSR